MHTQNVLRQNVPKQNLLRQNVLGTDLTVCLGTLCPWDILSPGKFCLCANKGRLPNRKFTVHCTSTVNCVPYFLANRWK